MRLIGDCSVGDCIDCAGRMVVVAVKLDSDSRELLTWALVKVAQPGDHVIALHVLDTISESTSSLLSLVKSFDSVLSVYEGFCHLKQVALKLKICRGSPVRKIIKRQVKSYGAATLIVGISKTHHKICSSASLAKYCARKLPRSFRVLAVNNGKIIFHRHATDTNLDQLQDKSSIEGIKSDPSCKTKTAKSNCVTCAPDLLVPDNSGTQLMKASSGKFQEENSLALVQFQSPKADTGSNFIVNGELSQLKSNWGLLRRVFLSRRQQIEKPLKKLSVFQYVMKLPSFHSSALVHPDQKQNNSHQDHCSIMDGENSAIVPFGFTTFCPLDSDGHSSGGLSKDLLNLHDKYSSTCRLFNYQELLSATSNFMIENLVGKGGSSHVYKGRLPDGKELAIKILKPSEDVIKEFVQEIEIITTLHHKNIISLFGLCFEDNNLLLVYDFVSKGSLEENLHGNKKDITSFGWQERFKVAVGVAEALDHLHYGSAKPVIHRDVKSSNILLSEDFESKLSDFGLATWASLSSSHIICTDVAGTFGYLAPEYFMHGKVSDKIDVYAFGVVLLELLSGRKPISSEYPKGQESLVMWAKQILKEGKVSHLLDPSLGVDCNYDQIGRMILAATLCIRRAARFRPHINLVLKLLQGDEEVTNWARQQVHEPEQLDGIDGEPLSSNMESHLNIALLDLEDEALSVSSGEQNISLEEYLQGRWSRSSSFS